MAHPLFLVGFMAAGKTSVGRALAAASGRRFVDLDDEIDVADAGSVAALVARDEPEFRRREAAALARVIAGAHDGVVVATGGGAAAHGDNLDRMKAAGCVVALGVDVPIAVARAAGGPARPLLHAPGPLAARRAPLYRRAHAVVDTSDRALAEVVRLVAHVEAHWRPDRDQTIVALAERSYPIVLADDFAGLAPRERDVSITDRNVAAHHVLSSGQSIAVAAGEASKSFATYQRLCGDVVALGLDRQSMIYAVGGGVVGDLAGFVAATVYRGLAVTQVPTTLVAMTDSAIGGKTGIDLPAGKNLVGAFHQPSLVHVNLATLATLPERERRAGFGELWKYALLDGADLFAAVDACTGWATAGGPPPPVLRDVIRRCVAYKAAIVGRDEREQTGQRALLNLGHTVGHAIESASGMLHGEAVALGLVAAARVSAALGLAPAALESQIAAAVARTGLAADPSPFYRDDVLARLGVDKKRTGPRVRFLAMREVGACEPVEILVTELQRILRSPPAT